MGIDKVYNDEVEINLLFKIDSEVIVKDVLIKYI